MTQTFLRRDAARYSKLGKGRAKKQRWKRPTGRDNKMRDKRRGYPATVSIGYQTQQKTRGLLEGKTPVMVCNPSELEGLSEKAIVVVGAVGTKKKIAIVQKAQQLKIPLHNVNPKTYLKKNTMKSKSTSAPSKTKEKTP